jgi:2-polyprenyl-6-methoxyphenol hydroxylase-like FAD-dependent oxidoreductase
LSTSPTLPHQSTAFTIISLYLSFRKQLSFFLTPTFILAISTSRMKILISGAGITGNALAFWLSKLGHAVTVIERFPSLRASGLQIDLRGYGVEVLKRMGLERAFREKSIPEQGMQMVDKTGRRRAFFPANDTSNVTLGFSSDWEIMRGDLCRIIYSATKDRVKYIFASSIESFKQSQNTVGVKFTDGSTDQFDLVIGADGQHSRTRKLMLGPNSPDAFYPMKGMYIGYFTIPRPIQEGETYIATSYMAPGGRGIMTRRHNDHEVQAYVGGATDSERLKAAFTGDVKKQKAALKELVQGAGWQADEILESLDLSDGFYCERVGQVRLDHWSCGRIVLAGDAAWCPSVMTGLGTTSGIVGAYILAGEIGRHSANLAKAGTTDPMVILSALESYEKKFRPFMAHAQGKASIERSRWDNFSSTAFGIEVINILMGIASFFRLDLLGQFSSNDIKDWDLPVYEELHQDEQHVSSTDEKP